MKTAFFNQQQTTMRFVIIGVIVLAMLIPLAMVEGVTEERQSFFDLTLADIANAWGNAQKVERERVYLPETLEIEVDVVHQYRRRAIYEVPVYSANILLRGGFPSLDPDVLNRSDVTVLPDRARIVMGVSHTQAISTASPLTTEDSAFEFHPGTGATWIGSGIHAPVEGHQGGAIQFEFELAMKGTRKLGFTPVGGSTRVRMTSTWPHPSFKGAYLPERFEVSDQGFSAEWVVHELARTLPDNWLTGAAAVELSESFAWISLFQPVTEYTIVDRAIKYGLLFIALTFLGFLCFELRTALRFHPVQYGVVGMGLVLFYLALLSLSEHLAFGPSYLIATGLLTGLIGWYVWAMTADVRLSGWMAVIVAGLYSTLYVLLQLEAFALLVGTAVLFIGLGALMAATRTLTGRNTESVSADGG
jgi:inner membrane protein